MAITKKAIVFDEQTNQHRELYDGAETLGGGAVQISEDADNILTTGTDGGLIVTLESVTQVVDPADLISSDPSNLIQQGSDQKLFSRTPIAADFISAQTGNSLYAASLDQKLYVGTPPAVDLISTNANNALTRGSDGKLFTPFQTSSSMISVVGQNDLQLASDGKLYVNTSDSMKIDASDAILTKSVNGVKGNVKLNYLSASRTIQLLGKNDQLISSLVLPEASVLQNATVATDPAGQPAGTYLVLTFTTSTGPEDVYIDMTEFNTVYTGDSQTVSVDTSTNSISVMQDPNGSLTASSAGLAVNIASLRSTDVENELVLGADGKLTVEHKPVSNYISTNAGNILVVGTDDKYFVPAPVVPAASDQTPLVSSGTGTVGTGTAYSREDHVHPAQAVPAASSTVPLIASGSGAVGSGTTWARSNHVHPAQTVPAAGTANPLGLGSVNVGTSTLYARQDHVHPQVAVAGDSTQTVSGSVGIAQSARWNSLIDTNDFVSPGMLSYAFPATGGFKTDAQGVRSVDFSQLPQAQIDALVKNIGGLIPLASGATFHVRTTGSDTTGTGSTASPFATIQKAIDFVCTTYYLVGGSVVINVGVGTFDRFFLKPYQCMSGSIVIVGAGKDQTIVQAISATAITGNDLRGSVYTITDMTLSIAAAGSSTYYGLVVNRTGTVYISNVKIGCTQSGGASGYSFVAIRASTFGSVIFVRGGMEFHNTTDTPSDFSAALYSSDGGCIFVVPVSAGSVYDVSGSFFWFAYSNTQSVLSVSSITRPVFNGTSVGHRYRALALGFIGTSNGGPNYFPGDIPGEVATGGIYL